MAIQDAITKIEALTGAVDNLNGSLEQAVSLSVAISPPAPFHFPEDSPGRSTTRGAGGGGSQGRTGGYSGASRGAGGGVGGGREGIDSIAQAVQRGIAEGFRMQGTNLFRAGGWR
jgi:hypothetical protein